MSPELLPYRGEKRRMRSAAAQALALTVLCVETGHTQDGAAQSARPVLTVINAGAGGNNTRNGLKRMDRDVIARKPHVCFIAFGMNDAVNSRNSVPIKSFAGNLATMAAKCREASIRPVFITINPCNEEKLYTRHKLDYYTPHGGANAMIIDYNRAIRKVATETGADVIDWHAEAMKRSGSSIEPGSVLRSDGVHLSPQGLAALARLAVDWMRKARLPDGAVVVAFGDSITKQGWIDMACALYAGASEGTEASEEGPPDRAE